MLDPNAQKSLLENAATVNQAILAVCEANVTEYENKLTSFTTLTGLPDENAKALYKETFGKEAQQSLNIKTLLDLPDMKKGKIENVITIMNDREKEDEVVEEKLKIAKETSTVSSTFRSSQTLKDLLGGDYIKDGGPIIRIDNEDKNVTFSLKVKSKTPDKQEMFICYAYSKNGQKMVYYIFHDEDPFKDLNFPTPEKEMEQNYISTVEEMKKNEYFKAWDAAVEPTAPAPLPQKETYNFQPADDAVYESADKKVVAKLLEDGTTGDVTVYLPIKKNEETFYLYVEKKTDFNVKEISSLDSSGSVLAFTDDDTVQTLKNTNESFYNWWKGGSWITSTAFSISLQEPKNAKKSGIFGFFNESNTDTVIPSAPFKPTGDRGTENILETWKSSGYLVKILPNNYTIPVGTLVSLKTSELDKNGDHRGDLSKYGLTLTPSNEKKLKRVMFDREKVVGVSEVLRNNVETPRIQTVLDFLSEPTNLAIMNQAIASNEELSKKFRDITAQEVFAITPTEDVEA